MFQRDNCISQVLWISSDFFMQVIPIDDVRLICVVGRNICVKRGGEESAHRKTNKRKNLNFHYYKTKSGKKKVLKSENYD